MAKGKQRLTIEGEAKGFEQAAQKVKKTEEAIEGLDKAAAAQNRNLETTAVALGDVNEGQEAASASAGDYAASLAMVSPRLGGITTQLYALFKIIGNVATQQLSLTKLWRGGSTAVRNYASTLKLLGVGGVAYLGISQLIGAITKLRDEMKEGEKAAKAYQAAQTAMATAVNEATDAIAAQQALKVGKEMGPARPLTFAEKESVRATQEAAPEDIRGAMAPILGVLGGAKGFGPAPGPMTGRELEDLARLGWAPEEGAPRDVSARAAQRFLARQEDNRRILEQSQRQGREAQRERAATEVMHPEFEGTANLDAMLGEISARYGVDPEQLRALVLQELPKEAKAGHIKSMGERIQPPRAKRLPTRIEPEPEAVSSLGTPYYGPENKVATPELVAAMHELSMALKGNLKGGAGQTNNYINSRFYHPGADSSRRATTNGQSVLRGWE